MAAGRKPEEAPDGMMLPREAAEILGVSAETVKKYIREEDGPLAGTYWPNDAGELRYYADAHSVHTLAAQRQESRHIVKRAGELHGDTRELLIGAINRQREEVVTRLDELLENQTQILSDFGEAIQVLREAAEKEEAHQRKTREHEQKLVQHQEKLNEFIATFGVAMTEFRQIESERRKRELEERRPFWKKLLGIR